jgi:AcrR family transcriptional regulator
MTANDIDHSAEVSDMRGRILAAASRLIAEGGGEAATTRAVAAAAGVQAPTIYRCFGDKRGLLSATAEYELARYVAGKENHAPHPDPVEQLRQGWDAHVAFCLSNPGLFAILIGDAIGSGGSAAAAWGREVLRRTIRRIAQSGRLTTSEDRALALVHSTATGVVLTLLQQPETARDPGMSAFARDTAIGAITRAADDGSSAGERRPQSAAAELRTALDGVAGLSNGERQLLGELLDRIAAAGA